MGAKEFHTQSHVLNAIYLLLVKLVNSLVNND